MKNTCKDCKWYKAYYQGSKDINRIADALENIVNKLTPPKTDTIKFTTEEALERDIEEIR